MKFTLLILLLISPLAEAANVRNKIADACSELTERDSTLLRNCVNHAELFELDSQFIRAASNFHRSVDVRMKALKSGASVDTLNLCRSLGWSTDNTLTCLRAYPTPESVRECRKLSPKEEDQLRCVREGRDASQISACREISSIIPERMTCLGIDIPAMATINCQNNHHSYRERLGCMKREFSRKEDEYKRDQKEMRAAALTRMQDPAYSDPLLVPPSVPRRMPASSSQRQPAAINKKSK